MSTTQNSRKQKIIKLITPRGVLKFPRLTKIDYGSEKYPVPEGVYRTQLVLDTNSKGVREFLEKLDELLEQSREEAEEQLSELPVKSRKEIEGKGGLTANKPYSIIYDEETEEPTGEVEIRIKKRATFKRADGERELIPPPHLFDSAIPPKLLPRRVEVWGGTQAIININATPYFMNTGAYGLSLRLNAVQILKLVDAGGMRDAADYGFEGQEDGWDSADLEDELEREEEETTSLDDDIDF